jgi:hypothetical protein
MLERRSGSHRARTEEWKIRVNPKPVTPIASDVLEISPLRFARKNVLRTPMCLKHFEVCGHGLLLLRSSKSGQQGSQKG